MSYSAKANRRRALKRSYHRSQPVSLREQYEAKVRERDAYIEKMRDTTTSAAGPMVRKALRLDREVVELRDQLRTEERNN